LQQNMPCPALAPSN